MSDYNKITNFTIKDSLPSGNTNKIIKGTELDNEFNAIQSAVSSKADANSPTFGGTPTAPTAASGTNNTQIATTAYVYNAPTINSPTFTGTPTAPTAEAGTSTTQLATTAFVTAAASAVLVDSSVTTSKLADNAVTPAKVSADTYAINVSGNSASADNGAKAWVNFSGVSPATINGSFNTSSVTRDSIGTYTVTFTTAMSDAKYAAVATAVFPNGVNVMTTASNFTASSVRIRTVNGPGTGLGIDFRLADCNPISVAIFR